MHITNRGLMRILQKLKTRRPRESVFQAHFDFELKSENVINVSFDTIAASGENATVLHYVTNNEFTKDGDLMLFDLGATKIYTVLISQEHILYQVSLVLVKKELYDMVLGAMEKVIDAIKPGVDE